jgi:hypothetical protein
MFYEASSKFNGKFSQKYFVKIPSLTNFKISENNKFYDDEILKIVE